MNVEFLFLDPLADLEQLYEFDLELIDHGIHVVMADVAGVLNLLLLQLASQVASLWELVALDNCPVRLDVDMGSRGGRLFGARVQLRVGEVDYVLTHCTS